MTKQPLSILLKKFRDARDGVAAVEFAIAVPMLLFSLIIMTDIGLAIHQRMNLDQAVRAGAEFAMNEVSDVDDLKSLIQGAATGAYYDDKNPAPDVAEWDPPNVDGTRQFCECPEAPGVSVACSTTICDNNLPASVYFHLVAAKTYDGIIIPAIDLKTDIRVQVR